MQFLGGNPFLYASCALLAIGVLQFRMENSYDEKIYRLFCFQKSTQKNDLGTGKGWYHANERLILLKTWKKKEKLIILYDPNVWCMLRSQKENKKKEKEKEGKSQTFLAHKYINLFFFYFPSFVLILSGNWDKLEPSSPLLLLQHFNLPDRIFFSCLTYEAFLRDSLITVTLFLWVLVTLVFDVPLHTEAFADLLPLAQSASLHISQQGELIPRLWHTPRFSPAAPAWKPRRHEEAKVILDANSAWRKCGQGDSVRSKPWQVSDCLSVWLVLKRSVDTRMVVQQFPLWKCACSFARFSSFDVAVANGCLVSSLLPM